MKTIQQVIAETPNATDAEILAAIEASREWRRVPVSEVTFWLLENGLLGVLQVVRDTATSVEIKAGLSEFLAGLTLYQSIDATNEAIRAKATALTQGLALARVITSDQIASFASLMKEPNTTDLATIPQARRRIAADALLAQFEAYASGFRDAVNAYVAGEAETLPTL